jgi:hypothetical protein
VNQESFAFMYLRKFKQYRRYYNELSKEFIHEKCLAAIKKDLGAFPDIVEMHIYAKAFHKAYRHAYAKERMNEKEN